MTPQLGNLARVRYVAAGHVHLEFTGGKILSIRTDQLSSDEVSYTVGEILLVNDQGQLLERHVPRDLWPTNDSVGVIKKVGSSKTLVEFGSTLRVVPAESGVPYREGNTVQADELWGVTEIISDSPISVFERDEEEPVENYIVPVSPEDEGLDGFGGHEALVDRARKLIEVPLTHAEKLAKIGAKPVRGVLFTGPPGTGKTKLARIIARRTGATFYAISGPQVFNKWYGASEKIIRRLFIHAGDQAAAVIFFDEIDSVAGQRDDSSHEASKRVVTQLLTSMDGLRNKGNVVVVATTNRPDDIDQALRRPGRFDAELNFPLPDEENRLLILDALSTSIAHTGTMPYRDIASATEGWSPAELESIWTEAALFAVLDDRLSVRAEDLRRGLRQVAATQSSKRQKVGSRS